MKTLGINSKQNDSSQVQILVLLASAALLVYLLASIAGWHHYANVWTERLRDTTQLTGELISAHYNGTSGLEIPEHPQFRMTLEAVPPNSVDGQYQHVVQAGPGRYLVGRLDRSVLMNQFIFGMMMALPSLVLVVAVVSVLLQRRWSRENRLGQLIESHYRDLVDNLPSGMMVLGSTPEGDYIIKDFNNGAERMEGLRARDVVGKYVSDLFPALTENELKSAMDHTMATGTPHVFPMHFYEDFRLSSWREHLFYRNATGDLVMIYDDVTERKRAEAARQMSNSVFQHSGEGIIITDTQARIVKVNPAFTAITGYEPDDVLGKPPQMLQSERQSPEFYRDMWRQMQIKGCWQGEIWNRRKNGEAYLEWLTINTIYDEKGRVSHYIGIFDDISELHEKDQRIRHQALHDALTGLANRTLLMDRLDHALNSGDHGTNLVAVVLLDLDRFKVVNDSLGHDVGDEILKIAANRLRASLRRADTVARLGGDEFVILFQGWSQSIEVAQFVEQVIDVIKVPFTIGGHDLHLTASLGVALSPADGVDAGELLKNADTAMNAAKQAGNVGYRFYDPSLNKQAMDRLELESALRQTLERGELEVHYQPKIRLADEVMTGVEALVRWRHPEQGMISPMRFIPLSEETGLIIPLGEWVLRRSCRQAALWAAAGYDFGAISVNVSAKQMALPGFAQVVERILNDEGVDPRWIELEITETAIMDDPEAARLQMESLQSIGLPIALDDFGIGHSSLGYLKRFPISVLKMDRSFVQDVTDDDGARALAMGIIQLAVALGIKVVAEGVETREQADFLRDNGCHTAQGYLFAKPMPAGDVEAQFLVANQVAQT